MEELIQEMKLKHTREIEKLSEFYLGKQMLTGRILSSDHQMKTANGICKIRSVYICEEMIGMLRKEEIIK